MESRKRQATGAQREVDVLCANIEESLIRQDGISWKDELMIVVHQQMLTRDELCCDMLNHRIFALTLISLQNSFQVGLPRMSIVASSLPCDYLNPRGCQYSGILNMFSFAHNNRKLS